MTVKCNELHKYSLVCVPTESQISENLNPLTDTLIALFTGTNIVVPQHSFRIVQAGAELGFSNLGRNTRGKYVDSLLSTGNYDTIYAFDGRFIYK